MRRRPQTAVSDVMFATWGEIGLAGAVGQWSLAWLPQPAAPHVEVYHPANPQMIGALLKAPYVKLPPEDIAVLDADPDKRQRMVLRAGCPLLGSHVARAMRGLHGAGGRPFAGCQRRTFPTDACAGAE